MGRAQAGDEAVTDSAALRSRMRIVVHDYAGHPFQVQLSRELARRGHTVAHWHCPAYTSGKGALERRPGDPESFTLTGIPMDGRFDKYSPRRRLQQEIAYGAELTKRLRAAKPDVVLMCNTPLVAHFIVARGCYKRKIASIFWQQDIYSGGIAAAARARLGVLGIPLARLFDGMERSVARRAARIVAISSTFLPVLSRWGVRERAVVIPNWAPLEELPLVGRDTAWAAEHGLVDRPVVMYAGTLGLKHNPGVLLELARAMQVAHPAGRVVVVSEGRGREWLAEQQRQLQLPNLLLLDFQPYSRLAEVHGSADVLLAILEPSASSYAVPSKILSYLCAGRPIVAIMGANNDAAETIRRSGGGIVVSPGVHNEAAQVTLRLLDDRSMRTRMGLAARLYAEKTFNVRTIATAFEEVFPSSVS